MRKFCAIVLCSILSGPGTLQAATLELMPMGGFQFFTGKDLAGPVNTHLGFDNRATVGLSLGYLFTDNGEIALTWLHSKTTANIDKTYGNPAEHFDLGVDQFQADFMYMTRPPPYQPFALLGLGATHFSAPSDRNDSTRFSFSVGGGVKWLFNDHVGVRWDARWIPAIVSGDTDLFCSKDGLSCVTTESNSWAAHQFPFINSFITTGGLLLRY